MAARIAETSWATGPDNKAVVVDVYATPPLTPVNNQSTGELGKEGGLLDYFKQNSDSGKLGFLKGIAKQYATTGKITPDKDTLIKNIGNVFGVQNGTLKTIPGKIMDNLLRANGFYGTGIGATVDGLSKQITGHSFSDSLLTGFSDVSLVVNNVKKDIKALRNLDFENFSDLSTALGKISGDSDFIRLLNLTEAAGVVKSLNDLASTLYIPGVADRLMADLKDEDRKIVTGLFNSSLTNINDFGTLDTLINNLTPEEILNTNPNIIKMAVAGYTGNGEYTIPSKEAADALIGRLKKLNPNWDSVRVSEGVYKNDLDVFKSFSSFARESFIIADYNIPELAIASSYTPKTFVAIAKETYPLAGISA